MYKIEFIGPCREGNRPEVIDEMMTDLTQLDKIVTHAKSLFSNVIVQRNHKQMPHGFWIRDNQGTEVARWSIDD
jgi:hypothetical protein